jgi:hypothetical protein
VTGSTAALGSGGSGVRREARKSDPAALELRGVRSLELLSADCFVFKSAAGNQEMKMWQTNKRCVEFRLGVLDQTRKPSKEK